MHSNMNEVIRRQDNIIKNIKVLHQKLEEISSRLEGSDNNTSPSQLQNVATLMTKLPLSSESEMDEFLVDLVVDDTRSLCITNIEQVQTSNQTNREREREREKGE